MDSNKFQSLLKDNRIPSASAGVEELVKHHHTALALTIVTLAPKQTLPPHHRFSDTLHQMKREGKKTQADSDRMKHNKFFKVYAEAELQAKRTFLSAFTKAAKRSPRSYPGDNLPH